MDPRLLLNSKALKKSLTKNVNKSPSKTKPREGMVKSSTEGLKQASKTQTESDDTQTSLTKNEISPRATRFYDPRALLNPKGVRSHQMSSEQKGSSSQQPSNIMGDLPDRSEPGPTADVGQSTKRQLNREDSGPRNMLEGLYGVERRVDQPRKKTKVTENEETKTSNNHTTYSRHSNGIIGEYMKPKPDAEGETTNLNNLVDLTMLEDDPDDDIQVTGSRNLMDQEVCFGLVKTTVHAYLVPKPKVQAYFGSDQEWPVMKCKLLRTPAKDTVIEALDPCEKPFGKIDLELATVLAPSMDGLKGLRTQARLINRRKKAAEWPHQACSETIAMVINIYGRRGDVEKIGKLFGHHNIWFRPPMAPENGVPIVNPHASKKPPAVPIRGSARGNILSESRTIEEAAQAVSKLFDYFAQDSVQLPETDGPEALLTPLLPHQKQALTFMLQHENPRTYGSEEAENTSLWRKEYKANGTVFYKDVVSGLSVSSEPEQVYGGLLADVMGLGKTLEALSLLASTVDEAKAFSEQKLMREDAQDSIFLTNTKSTLIICPTSTVKNWEDQIREHIAPDALSYYVYHGPGRTRNAYALTKYDIVIATYGVVSAEFAGRGLGGGQTPIRQLKWFRIILDEAHTIREPKAMQSQAIYSLWAQRRWCLTGTPIQNRIDDLGSLTRFLQLYPYDTSARFNQYVRSPAQSGDATFLKALRVFVDSFTLRRLRDRINLPPRQDLIEKLEFSPQEASMHKFFKELAHVQILELAKSREKKSGVQLHVLQGIMTLRLICAHGRDLLKSKDLSKLKGSTAVDAIDVDQEQEHRLLTRRAAYENMSLMAEADLDLCKNCDKKLGAETPREELEDAEGSARCYVLPCFDTLCSDCFSSHKSAFDDLGEDEVVACPYCSMIIRAQYIPIEGSIAEALETMPDEAPAQAKATEDLESYSGPHTKTLALLRDIGEMNVESAPLVAKGEPPIKCVVFSEFTSHLDLIGRALTEHGHTFVRIDGSMSLPKRRKVLDALAGDNNVTILLASIKAAGQGLNLTAASRAFIMEPMWNPAAEAQAVDRIYRIGQERAVIVKRFQMADSIEMKIVELQQKKQKLADISMNRNHKQLNKKELREQHYKDIVALFK